MDSTQDARATAPTATRRTTCSKAPLDSGTQLTPGMICQVPRTRGDRAIMKKSCQVHLLYRGTTATWMNSTVSYFLKYNSSLKKDIRLFSWYDEIVCVFPCKVPKYLLSSLPIFYNLGLIANLLVRQGVFASSTGCYHRLPNSSNQDQETLKLLLFTRTVQWAVFSLDWVYSSQDSEMYSLPTGCILRTEK